MVLVMVPSNSFHNHQINRCLTALIFVKQLLAFMNVMVMLSLLVLYQESLLIPIASNKMGVHGKSVVVLFVNDKTGNWLVLGHFNNNY